MTTPGQPTSWMLPSDEILYYLESRIHPEYYGQGAWCFRANRKRGKHIPKLLHIIKKGETYQDIHLLAQQKTGKMLGFIRPKIRTILHNGKIYREVEKHLAGEPYVTPLEKARFDRAMEAGKNMILALSLGLLP